MPTPASDMLRFGVFEIDAGLAGAAGLALLHSAELRLLSRPGGITVTRDELRRVLWTSD